MRASGPHDTRRMFAYDGACKQIVRHRAFAIWSDGICAFGARMRRSSDVVKPRPQATSTQAERDRKDASMGARLRTLLNREAEDVNWLARRLNVDHGRASALLAGCTFTAAEEIAIERLLSGA